MFIYERGQCGSANDILALSSDQALMTIDIARGTIQLSRLWTVHRPAIKGVYPKGVRRAISHIFESGGLTDWSFALHIFV